MKSKRNYESEILDIIKTKDWSRARASKNRNLYVYIQRHKNTDGNCRIISEHIKPRDHKSEILEIIETKDWDRARQCNDKYLYNYIFSYKDTDENCKIVWEHMTKKHCPYTIKDYLLYYFKHEKSTKISNKSLYIWFIKEIKNNNRCCTDIKNLIIAAATYKDPVALETLELIKKHLEKEGV